MPGVATRLSKFVELTDLGKHNLPPFPNDGVVHLLRSSSSSFYEGGSWCEVEVLLINKSMNQSLYSMLAVMLIPAMIPIHPNPPTTRGGRSSRSGLPTGNGYKTADAGWLREGTFSARNNSSELKHFKQ